MHRLVPHATLTRSLLAASACAAAVAGLGASAAASSAAAKRHATSHGSVAFVPGATGVGFYITMGQGIQAEAKKLGMSYTTQGSPNFDPTDQTPVVSAVCARHPTLLLVAPTDPVAMRPAIQTCMSDGVKVVTVDTGLTNTKGLVSAVTSNNIQGGELAAQLMIKKLHGSGQIAVESLSPTATTQVLRVRGFVRYIKKHAPKIKIVSTQFTQQATSSSETTTAAILSAHPQLKGVFGAAEPNGEGAAAAAKSANKKLTIVCYDADPPEVKLLRSGAISGLVIQQPALEGKTAVRFGADFLAGKKSAIKKSVVLPNVLVTTAQSRSAHAKKFYYAG